MPDGHALANRIELDLPDLAAQQWVLTPRSSWPPWHRQYDNQFRAAGFHPDVVQYDPNPQNLLGLVAAGVGITRLTESAQYLRRGGVSFIPMVDAWATTDLIWSSSNSNPVLPRLVEVALDVAETEDLIAAG